MDQLRKDLDLSIDAERKLARTLMGRIEWEMILIGLGQLSVWITTWALVINAVIPLWAGFLISTISTMSAYLPSHAGQHGHLSGKNKNLKWVNYIVGQLSLIPLSQSHDILKATHLKHHAYTNDPEKDPDYFHTHVDSWWDSAVAINFQTGVDGKLAKIVEKLAIEDPKFGEAMERGGNVALGFLMANMILAVLFPLETLLLWWLPRKIATSYLGIVFSHMPHKGLTIGRYKDTKFWTNGIPRFFNHSMQIHVMHHMYPNICHFDEPKAIELLRPFMIARGIPGAEDSPEKIRFNPMRS